jgi:3-hydroxy-3-methylglutaryl CoA synthase
MQGILSAAAYVPYRRLDRSSVAEVFGSGGGRGSRAVAGYDEDTTSMGVEAARLVLRNAPEVEPRALWFSTTEPAYLDKTNATTLHAALRLDSDVVAADFAGAIRSGVAALGTALHGDAATLVVTADIRDGLPTSADESAGGDGAAAVLVGTDRDGPLLAELVGEGHATEEFIDRWRDPGDRRSKVWEERFGETKYVPLGEQAWNAALKAAQLSAEQIDRLIVTGSHARAVRSLTPRLGVDKSHLVDDRSATVGYAGAAMPGLLLTAALEAAAPGETIALVSLADGADVLLFRTTDEVARWTPTRTVDTQIAAGEPLPYGKFLAWRGMVTLEPPRRPEPSRISASVTGRTEHWKYGFVGSKDRSSDALHLPPQRVSRVGDAVDQMDPAPMADVDGTIAAFTIDRIAYSPSPPIVFAIVDFDGGGRLPIELTDVNADELAVGDRVEMTFRRLFTADGVRNYFWKARPLRGGSQPRPEEATP